MINPPPHVVAILPAYIDAGTGVLIIQFLIAGAATGLYFIGRFWKKIISYFKRDKKYNE